MATKTIQNLKNSLKFKVDAVEGTLSVLINGKRHKLPVAVRVAHSDTHAFVSIPASSEIYGVSDSGLTTLDSASEATSAIVKGLTPAKAGKTAKATASTPEMPAKLVKALADIPTGTRLVFKDGKPMLVRMRNRTQAAAPGEVEEAPAAPAKKVLKKKNPGVTL